MDNRVVKKFAKYLGVIAGCIMLIAISTVISKHLFGDPEIIFNTFLLIAGLGLVYEIASTRVKWERESEQRLADKIRDLK